MSWDRFLLYPAAAVLSWPVAGYILRQRNRLAPYGVPLRQETIAKLQNYFDDVDLKRARIVIADPLPIPHPPFVTVVRRLGFDFPGVDLTAAITLDHVIASRERMNLALLFHELVHVVQYRLLGVGSFAHLYVRGFLAERSYNRIPLESCAFALERRFTAGGQPFRVEAEVRGWMNRCS